MTEHRTKQCILKAVRGGYVTSPPVNRSVFADIAIGNGGHGDESFTRGTSNPDTPPAPNSTPTHTHVSAPWSFWGSTCIGALHLLLCPTSVPSLLLPPFSAEAGRTSPHVFTTCLSLPKMDSGFF